MVLYDILAGDGGAKQPVNPDLIDNDNGNEDKGHDCHDAQRKET